MVDGVNQQPGLFQRIGNFFGAGDPNAGGPTDPFANLSRAQRTMLGFDALRDAAAALEGRDTNFFAQSLGGFEQARERERLRTQGEMQNRVQALQALATLNEQARFNQAFGLPSDPAMDALREMLMQTAGLSGGAAPMAGGAPAVPGAVAPAQGGNRLPRETVFDPVTGTMVPYTGEPEGPAPEVAPAPTAGTDFDAQRQAIFDQMRLRASIPGAGFADLQAELANIDRQEAEAAALAEQAATETEALEASAAQAESLILPEIDEALNFLVQGFDAEGNVIFNPALMTRAGRLISGALEGPEYQNFVGAIETLQTGVLLEALSRATVGALSDAERMALQAEQGKLDPANPIGTFRALQRIQRIGQESINRRNREAGIAPTSSAPSVSWD